MQDLSRYKKRDHIQIQTRHASAIAIGAAAALVLTFALGALVGGRAEAETPCPTVDPLEALDAKSGEPKPPSAGADKELKTFHETLTRPLEDGVTPASLVAAGSPEKLESLERSDRLETPRHSESLVPEEMRDSEPGSYSLQVDSFRDRLEASRLVGKLEKAGHPAYLVSVDNPERGGKWFRVRIGPFSTKVEAKKYKVAFEEKERLATFVVKRKESDG